MLPASRHDIPRLGPFRDGVFALALPLPVMAVDARLQQPPAPAAG